MYLSYANEALCISLPLLEMKRYCASCFYCASSEYLFLGFFALFLSPSPDILRSINLVHLFVSNKHRQNLFSFLPPTNTGRTRFPFCLQQTRAELVFLSASNKHSQNSFSFLPPTNTGRTCFPFCLQQTLAELVFLSDSNKHRQNLFPTLPSMKTNSSRDSNIFSMDNAIYYKVLFSAPCVIILSIFAYSFLPFSLQIE